MGIKKIMTAGIVAGAAALAIANANIANAKEGDAEKEKCYGIVKAGHNDCGDAMKAHSCMGQAMEDGNGHEWVALPKGLCEKLVGASLEPGKGGSKASCKSKSGCEGMSDMKDKGGMQGHEEKTEKAE